MALDLQDNLYIHIDKYYIVFSWKVDEHGFSYKYNTNRHMISLKSFMVVVEIFFSTLTNFTADQGLATCAPHPFYLAHYMIWRLAKVRRKKKFFH